MLFRRKQTRLCGQCRFAAPAEEGYQICRKKGLVPTDGGCRRFRYDPLQREPKREKPLDFSKYDDVDFSL